MSERAPLPDPNSLKEAVFDALHAKADLPYLSMIALGILAGMYIGLGGLIATVALAGGEALPFGVGQILAGLAFASGLLLVLVAGAELFTGNTLMIGPVVSGQVPVRNAIRALGIVYGANLVGSLILVGLAVLAGVQEGGDGAVGVSAVELAVVKTDKSVAALIASGILANMLVCLAVWMAYGGHTVTEKLFGLILPIMVFVAAGLEHSVANMYLLPFAYVVQPDTVITLGAVVNNLVCSTIGNIVGGAFVAVIYGYIHPDPES